jgi:hypothetical protein
LAAEISPTLAQPSGKVREQTPPNIQPRSSGFIVTPPCSQPRPSDLAAGGPLSQQSTSSSLQTTSSSSSLVWTDDVDALFERICVLMRDVADECRICWVLREKSSPHATFRCRTKMCSGRHWQTFKADLQFPKNVICYFCLALYGPPFNHPTPPPGTKRSPDLCEYPDVLKEVAFILYSDEPLRNKIFAHLGIAPPSSMFLYKRYITKKQNGGVLGVYRVIGAYLDIREAES